MSLKEAYSLAHTAQCRLTFEANRPERNLRFVVGHLMHYENLRLRIVEMEYDVSRSSRASAVAFKGTGHANVNSGIPKKPSTGQLGRKRSPPPPPARYDAGDSDEDARSWSGGEDDEEAGDGLSLERFPSGTARPPQPPPDLLPDDDNDDDDYDDEPESPEEPDQATLEALIHGKGSEGLVEMYDGVRQCPCHKHQDAPAFEQMWELPAREGDDVGVMRAVAQVAA